MSQTAIKVTTNVQPHLLKCHITGELDHATTDHLAATVLPWLARNTGSVVLDLREAEIWSAEGYQLLTTLHREAAVRGNSIHFHLSPIQRKIFRILGLDRRLRVIISEAQVNPTAPVSLCSVSSTAVPEPMTA